MLPTFCQLQVRYLMVFSDSSSICRPISPSESDVAPARFSTSAGSVYFSFGGIIGQFVFIAGERGSTTLIRGHSRQLRLVVCRHFMKRTNREWMDEGERGEAEILKTLGCMYCALGRTLETSAFQVSESVDRKLHEGNRDSIQDIHTFNNNRNSVPKTKTTETARSNNQKEKRKNRTKIADTILSR